MSEKNLITVNHYGLLTDTRGVRWLHQERGGTNALGLAEKSPFIVRPKKRTLFCPHMITLVSQMPDPVQVEAYERVKGDKVVELLEPWPRSMGSGGVHYFTGEADKLYLHFSLFSRLTSPVRSIVHHIVQLNAQAIMDELSITNIQPLVVVGLEAKHTQLIELLSQAALTSPRALILLGAKDVPLPSTVTRVDTEIHKFDLADLMYINWESIGAAIIRRAMRGESRVIDWEEWRRRKEQRREKFKP